MHHDNDNMPRTTTAAIPLAIRLARAGREEDLKRLIRHGTVVTVPSWLSADGNLPEVEGKPQADRVTEIRPSPDEMVRLAAKDAISAREGYGPITAAELDTPTRARLRFDAKGQITEWRGGDERWHDATELFRQPKGKRRKSEAERQDDNARHLSIRGSSGFPEQMQRSAVPSYGEDFRRLRAAHWVQAMGVANDNRRDIDRIGVGGRHSFDEAWSNARLYPACRIPRHITAIAKGAEFMAFRVHSNPRAMQGGVEGGHDLVERQIVETIDAPRIDAALGEHAKLLDLSIAGMTAREIAAKMGWGNTKQSERKAVAAQDSALEALADVEKLAA
ncbi:hypothetical protein [Nitrobacter sp.]|uniref:hypothetical protein n=1 Tax=Nitrobacter sp. TaxID=29420 RepID=UPI003F6545B8